MRIVIVRRRLAWVVLGSLVLLALAACGGGAAGDGGASGSDAAKDGTSGSDIVWPPPLSDAVLPRDGVAPVDTKVPDVPDGAAPADVGGRDADADVNVCGPSSPLFGPCQSNEDCPEGLCVWDPATERLVCTTICVEACPCGWQCRLVAGTWPEAASVCLPPVDRLCHPCDENDDCVNPSDLCLPVGSDPEQPTFCAKGCGLSGACPDGYTCSDVTDEGGVVVARQCLPDTGSCVCSAELVGNTRPCQRTNESGTCAGEQTCEGAAGWSPCTAAEPAPETCNTKDDDCDGAVDEGFVWTDPAGTALAVGASCGAGVCAGGVVVCVDPDAASCSGLTQQRDEVCNQLDDDCDGATDEDVVTTFYQDQDRDGQGWLGITLDLCPPAPEGWVANADDCDDYDRNTGLGFPELCDSRDNDCDGETDNDIFYASPTGEPLALRAPCGTGLCRGGIVICAGETGAACSTGGYAQTETCDGRDEDCDGVTDNTCDDDGDGYCDIDAMVAGTPSVCPDGPGDCDDEDPDFHPGADERCDGRDQDCDGETDEAYVDCQGRRCTGDGDDYFETTEATCEAGACVSPDPRSCRLYTCSEGGAEGDRCAETCANDTFCVAAAHCEKDASTCVPDVPDGGPCAAPNECASGHCQNGYCCAAGDCCDVADHCPVQFTREAVCDDQTTCQGHRGAASCVDHVCGDGPDVDDDRACGRDLLAVDCSPNAPLYCTADPDQTPPQCSDVCLADGDCVDGYHCDERCLPDRPDGGPCDENSDCVSGHCENGFCCAAGDCCQLAEDCPPQYGGAPFCETPATCQGYRADPVCGDDNVCSMSEAISDDSGCTEEVLADECGPALPVFCNGTFDQRPPECPTTCEDDDACDPDAHCDGSCELDVDNGETCDEDSDCVSAHCTNGFCCGGGVCCAAAADCPAEFRDAPLCDDGATCQGHRIDATCDANVCGRSARVDDDSDCGADLLANGCGSYVDRYCTGDAEQTPPECPTTCGSDLDCQEDAHCDGSCVPDLGDGATCDEDGDCQSGHCQNGFCCGAGDCCVAPGDCPSTYAQPATCDDATSCQGHRVDRACQANSCVSAEVADDSACGAGLLSDDCGRFLAVTCTGAANQNDPACPTSCTADAQCDPGAHCDGACVDDSGGGAICDEDSDCLSGHCQNGHCCASGDCCAVASDCPPAYSAASTCADATTCQGTRVSANCQSNRCGSQPVDDDSGCAGQLNDTCGPYPTVYCSNAVSQSDPACPATCANDNDCDPNAHCDGGRCLYDLAQGETCDEPSDCESGLYCADGVCCNSSCTGTCRRCDVSGSRGTCSSVPWAQDPDSECGAVACSSYYWGWNDRTCYRRADVPAGTVGCDGTGSCQDANDLCGSQGQGSTYLTCPSPCKAPNSGGSCTGQSAGTCINQNPGTITCGTGACFREVAQCVNGAVNTCSPGNPTSETCNNIDDDCDGTVDNNISSAADGYEPNSSCTSYRSLGTVAEDSSEASWNATLYPRGDVDWYRVYLNEGSHTCLPLTGQTYTIRARLVPPSGSDCVDYDLYVHSDSDCTNYLVRGYNSGCTAEDVTWSWSGTCAFDDSRYFRIGVVGFSNASECKNYTLYVDMY